jgi:hypothetical protein
MESLHSAAPVEERNRVAMVDRELEQSLRESFADPKDPWAISRGVLSLLRAQRVKEASLVVEPLKARFWAACPEGAARRSGTPTAGLTLSAQELDLLSLVASAAKEDVLPYYGAARSVGGSDLADAAFDACLQSDWRGEERGRTTRLIAAVARSGSVAIAERLHSILPAPRELDFLARMSWANLIRRHRLPLGIFQRESLESLRRFASLRLEGVPDPFFELSSPAMERQPRRQFGAHGGDYEFGALLALNSRLEHRLMLFDQPFIEALLGELSALAEDFGLPSLEHFVFSEGYGFAWSEGWRPPDEKIRSFAEVISSWAVLPGRVFSDGRRPFDIVNGDEALAERFRRDLVTHPARSPKGNDRVFWASPAMELLARVGAGNSRSVPDCSDLIADAQELYVGPGREAVRLFYESFDRGSSSFLPFHEE